MSTLQLSTLKPGRNLSLKGYSFNQIYTLTPTEEKDASIEPCAVQKPGIISTLKSEVVNLAPISLTARVIELDAASALIVTCQDYAVTVNLLLCK